jgi:hypothetical protein
MKTRKQQCLSAVVSVAGMVTLLCGCARELPNEARTDMETANKVRDAFSGSGGEVEVVAMPDPTGYATLSGVFKYGGNAPPFVPLVVSGGDATLCGVGANSPLARTIAVGSDGGLANVLVYVEFDRKTPLDDERWVHPSFADSAEDTIEFDQKNCVFLTRMAAMRSTQTMKVLNSDPVGHNTKIEGNGKTKSDNSIVIAGGTSLYQPGGASKGAFPVSCNIHPWMKAYMFVADHPYYAVTDEQGKFEIPNIPAGVELTFRVWQEATTNVQDVKVGFDGSAPAQTKWSKGKFKLTLTPDLAKTMDVVVTPF